MKKYLQAYGKYNLVTPQENQRLMPFQRSKNFISPEVAYQKANVQLLKINDSDLKSIKERKAKTIEKLLLQG